TFKDSDFAANLTMREKVSQLTQPQNCQSCHSVINPLGFSLEQYDTVGRFRTSDRDRPVDPVSEYTTDDGQVVRLTGAHDVAEFAINSDQAQNAFIQQLFHHTVKQSLLAYGADTLKQLRQTFVATDFNMQKLLAEIVTASALREFEKPAVSKVSSLTKKIVRQKPLINTWVQPLSLHAAPSALLFLAASGVLENPELKHYCPHKPMNAIKRRQFIKQLSL